MGVGGGWWGLVGAPAVGGVVRGRARAVAAGGRRLDRRSARRAGPDELESREVNSLGLDGLHRDHDLVSPGPTAALLGGAASQPAPNGPTTRWCSCRALAPAG